MKSDKTNKVSLTLTEHQEIIYDLIFTLDDFCKDNNIKYFLGYGTLLGAIRHHGIIPWDDDADILMERSEYERFQELINKNAPRGYRAYSIYNTKGYYLPFIKFGRTDTLVTEPNWKCTPKKGIGVNIDIFPLDGCPGDTREEAIEYASHFSPVFISELQGRFYRIKDIPSLKGKIKRALCFYKYLPVFQKLYFIKKFDSAKSHAVEDCRYFCCLAWSFDYTKDVHNKATIQSVREILFGQRLLPAPIGYDEILTEEYGDYMTPPPEEERISTHEHGCVVKLR